MWLEGRCMGKVLVQPQTLLYLSEERLWTPAVAGVAMGVVSGSKRSVDELVNLPSPARGAGAGLASAPAQQTAGVTGGWVRA